MLSLCGSKEEMGSRIRIEVEGRQLPLLPNYLEEVWKLIQNEGEGLESLEPAVDALWSAINSEG